MQSSYDRDEYTLIILCHTVSNEEREECKTLAFNKKMQLYVLTSLISPQNFWRETAKFLST